MSASGTRATLAARLLSAQPVTQEQAARLAAKILAADPDIVAAAVAWAASGVMPDSPVVRGRTPAQLARGLYPSQVFTALIALRADPERTELALRTFRGPRP